MRIWVDLTNSPHVLLFEPLIARLRKQGHEVVISARDFAQTLQLCEDLIPDAIHVGAGEKIKIFGKINSLVSRVRQLKQFAAPQCFDVAVSHGSYDQAIAAKMLGIPALVMVDYEYQPANHLSFRLAKQLCLPAAFADEDVARRGGRGKTIRYEGLKEEVYLRNYHPDPLDKRALGIDDHEGPVVTLRPPPTGALYNREENPLWGAIIDQVNSLESTRTILLPRHQGQVVELAARYENDKIRVPRTPVDGKALVWWSDAVISGGGTMNREAVVFGVPVWSLFSGKLGAVDKQLIAQGNLRHFDTPEDVKAFCPSVRQRGDLPQISNRVSDRMCAAILTTAHR